MNHEKDTIQGVAHRQLRHGGWCRAAQQKSDRWSHFSRLESHKTVKGSGLVAFKAKIFEDLPQKQH